MVYRARAKPVVNSHKNTLSSITKQLLMKIMKMTYRLIYFLVFALLYSTSSAFVGTPSFVPRQRQQQTTTALQVSEIVVDTLDLAINSPVMLPNVNPHVEAEVLTDMSHVALDFTGFFKPSRASYLVFAVLGRLLLIAADYLPDHAVSPEELAVQMFLLGTNVNALVTSIRRP